MLTSHPYYKVATTIIFVVAQIWLTVNSFSEEDEIHILPGQPPVGFRQYAGYITVDDVHQRSMFYYFVEAEGDYMSKPLVLWLQGGLFIYFSIYKIHYIMLIRYQNLVHFHV